MKYPSTPEGLAVSPYELGFRIPTEEDYQIRGGVEMHHLYFPKAWYNPQSDGYGAWRGVFRNLVINIAPLLTQEHNAGFADSVHDKYRAPAMPPDFKMIEVIDNELFTNGIIKLHNYRREQPPRMMPEHQWATIRSRYKARRHS